MAARVTHAVRADLDRVGSMLARAFDDDPVQQWVFEGAPDRLAALDDFLTFFAGQYFEIGHTYVGDGTAGATLWAPPDRHALGEDDIPGLLGVMSAHLAPDVAIARLTELGRAIEYLPAEPHFYLGIAGVDPSHQGRGLGGVLLEPGLAAADAGGFVAHLESSNPRHIPVYERHGFRTIARYTCGGPDGPVMTIMQRPPGG